MEVEEIAMDDFDIQRPSKRSVRPWLILWAVFASGLAVVMTTLFIWHAVTYIQKECASQHINASVNESTGDFTPVLASVRTPCPEFPANVTIPHPLPDGIKHILFKLDSYLSEIIDKNTSLPAISGNIFHGDSVLWRAHYGSKVYNLSKATKPDGNTVYRIGSVTKIFTVLFIYKLYENGVIDSLDDLLSKYAPTFHINNPFTNEDVTLKQIASQMSGLPRESPCVYSCTETNSTEQLKLLRARNLVISPWTTPSYSNLGYALLGRLLTENLLNKTFENWVREEILHPLGMNNTGFEITGDVETNMAFSYLRNGERNPSRAAFLKLGWASPAGEMYSTMNDLTKLGMMFTRPWTQKVFKASTIREMSLPSEISPDGRTVWGSPFEMFFSGGFVVRGKTGNIDTYETFFAFEPRLQLGMNVLISARGFLKSGSSTAMEIAAITYDLLLPALNKTLFSLQTFPTDPKPFIGHFLLTHTLPITLKTFQAIAEITVFSHFLRLQYVHVQPSPLSIRIRHIGLPLTFQASYHYEGISCLEKRSGILTDMYFRTPGQGGVYLYFDIPGWRIDGRRVATNPNKQARVLETESELINSFFKQLF